MSTDFEGANNVSPGSKADQSARRSRIEEAARTVTSSVGRGRKWKDMTPRDFARALDAAGLLADPAGQDSTTQWQRANAAEVRAERADDDARIEAAAKVIHPLTDTIYGCAIDGGYEPPANEAAWSFADRIAWRLADSGQLADPAGRDARVRSEFIDQVARDGHSVEIAGTLVSKCDTYGRTEAHLRAERAEDEAAELRAALDRVRALADEVEHRMMVTAKPSEIRAALGGEQS